MKSIIPLLSILLILFSTVLFSGCQRDPGALQVNDVVSDPGAFKGVLNVVGVVNAFSQSDPTILGIMDKKELVCTKPGCKKVLMPVQFTGKRPALGDEIVVSGAFQNLADGLIFKADSMEVLASHELGGGK